MLKTPSDALIKIFKRELLRKLTGLQTMRTKYFIIPLNLCLMTSKVYVECALAIIELFIGFIIKRNLSKFMKLSIEVKDTVL